MLIRDFLRQFDREFGFLSDLPEKHRFVVLANPDEGIEIEAEVRLDEDLTRALHERFQANYSVVPPTWRNRRVVLLHGAFKQLARRDPHNGKELSDDSPLATLTTIEWDVYLMAFFMGLIEPSPSVMNIRRYVREIKSGNAEWSDIGPQIQVGQIETANPGPERKAWLQVEANRYYHEDLPPVPQGPNPNLLRPFFREWMMAALGSQEITTLAFDHFPEVYNNFSVGMTTTSMVLAIIDFAIQKNQVAELATALFNANTARGFDYLPRFRTLGGVKSS